MFIRKMTLNDYESVDLLMQQLHNLHVKNRPDMYIPLAHPYSKEEFIEKVEDPNCISILAQQHEEVLGICFVTMREKSNMVTKRVAYMDDLCVSETAQRQGIARMLFQEAEKQAIHLGATRLDLMVWDFNKAALKFYESLGMHPQRYIFEKEL